MEQPGPAFNLEEKTCDYRIDVEGRRYPICKADARCEYKCLCGECSLPYPPLTDDEIKHLRSMIRAKIAREADQAHAESIEVDEHDT